MRIYLGYLVRGEFYDYYDNLLREISSRFNLENLLKKSRIPHITFKSPFETAYYPKIDDIINNFCNMNAPPDFKIDGFGLFDRDVVYFKVFTSNETKQIIGTLFKCLQTIPNISFDKYDDKNKELHITLMKNREITKSFDEVWKYVSFLTPYFILPFDNITIFRKEQDKTRIHKVFELG